MDVFTHSIRYLKDQLLQDLCLYELSSRVDDITFVLTVPAMWDDTAKMFMREAAIGVRYKLMVYTGNCFMPVNMRAKYVTMFQVR